MFKKSMVLFIILVAAACSEEEKPVPVAPKISDAKVICKADSKYDYEVVDKITVNISDPDRDLKVEEIFASVNGSKIKLGDGGEIDDIFEWSPPSSWDPAMMCRGDFKISIRAKDASGLSSKERFTVSK